MVEDGVKEIVAIMVLLDGTWYIFKHYRNNKQKTWIKARAYMKSHRIGSGSVPRFKITTINVTAEQFEGLINNEKEIKIQNES